MSDTVPFTSVDLQRYRQVYALGLLLLLPSFRWVAEFPDALFTPPPGPFALAQGFPAHWVLLALEVGLALALAALFVGVFVGAASVATTLLLVLGYGFSYSLGKIDHSILVVISPLVLLAAGWSGKVDPRPWVMRLLAWVIGLGFLTAGLPKVFNGWLDLSTHATQGWFVQSYYSQERDAWLAGWLVDLQTPLFWEPLDWAAVMLELSIIVAAVASWKSWRLALAALVLFHVGVLLIMNINFADQVLVYAAFVAWGRLPWPTSHFPAWSMFPIAVAGWSASLVAGEEITAWVRPIVLGAAAVVGTWYLLQSFKRALRAATPKGRRAAVRSAVEDDAIIAAVSRVRRSQSDR